MLARLEMTYLGILRVVILIVATIALLIAGLALAGAVPPLVRRITASSGSETPQPSLASFIDEKKLEGTEAARPPGGGDVQSVVDTDVKEAAFNLERYLRGRSAASEADWEAMIQKSGSEVVPGQTSDYYVSVHRLTEQLLAAKGRPLTLDRVAELLQWHQQRFNEAINQRDAQQASDAAQSTFTLALAGGAFLFFVLIVFIFLFVKIERSLRLVRTVHVGGGPDAI